MASDGEEEGSEPEAELGVEGWPRRALKRERGRPWKRVLVVVVVVDVVLMLLLAGRKGKEKSRQIRGFPVDDDSLKSGAGESSKMGKEA